MSSVNADNNSAWDSFKLCKPTLSPNIEYESRSVRDERWLVLRNTVSGDHVRLNASATELLHLIDGKKTVEQLCVEGAQLGITAEQISDWFGSMCFNGLLSLGSQNEQERLIAQYHKQLSNQKRSRYSNPLAIKIPLHNPDGWLGAMVNKLPWLFSRWFLITIISVLMVAVMAAIVNGSIVYTEFKRVAASPTHWWLYLLLYPALKAIHELAHALVIKRWGGAVHETGITFLILMPIPYVDASDAWMFPGRTQRVLVGAAGMLAECTLAAIGLFVFLTVQPGFLQNIGFAMFVMGSAATLMFNANPLLKFDGYYILQDWIDIPNLYARAQSYCRYLVRKYMFCVTDAKSPVSATGEKKWLFTYGVLSIAYRCIITIVIALFLASEYLILGVALALFAMYQLLINPILKLRQYLIHSPELEGIRQRSIVMTLGFTAVLALVVGFIPMPSSTRTEGVVWVPNQAQVFAAEQGVVEKIMVQPGTLVKAGQLLMRLQAPELQTAQQVAQAELQAVQISYRAVQQSDTAKAQRLLEDIESLKLRLDNLSSRVEQLDVVAGIDGMFVVDDQLVLAGRQVQQGELLAHVVNKKDLVVKAVLTQQRMERFQAGVEAVNVRLADRFSHTLAATLTRQTPAAQNTLPSPALAYDGRGGIAVASQMNEQLQTLEKVFHIELALPSEASIAGIGGRAYVTLHHQPESLGKRWWRSTRQLLLKQLTV